MVRRLLVLLSALSLILPASVAAQDPSPLDRFERAPNAGAIDPQLLPRSFDDDATVRVMLEMRGAPVAAVQATKPNKELTKAERQALKAELKARQDAIKPQIGAAGGRVLSQVQSAYNGIKVDVPRNKVPDLAALPNVTAVHGVQVFTRGNVTSVPFLDIPEGVWEDLGYTGEGVKIAVIDTGIDYTHANFGGPGTVEAYEQADASDTTIGDAGDAGLFGPDAPKVKGGTDLVGDDYDASADPGEPALIPHPDADPLDCPFTSGSVGHGSHVAGTATGLGVLASGETYDGPYDSTAYENEFTIGPGVAPEADLYFVRVFGCDGSTDVTVEAIDWAVENDMDVINMSLGSPFGRSDDPSAVAATNAAAAGVSVVTSAGNSGSAPYITGSPGTGTGSISVAAIDSNTTFPGVILDLDTGESITTISANGIVPEDGTTYNVVFLTDDPETADENESLGCSVEAYTKAGITEGGNQLGVSVRGTCARVARAIYAEQAGAAAAAMVNNAAGFPPFEGPILSNPDTGEPFVVTIPFLGVRGGDTPDAAALDAADTATTTATTVTNPGFRQFASFSSGGPRGGDSGFKPDITAPGVSTISTASGTGNKAQVLSGTSMASPHVAGIAALVRQAHPDWTTEEVKAAIVNTGDPAGFSAGYSATRGGTGLVVPAAAVATNIVALGDMVPANDSIGLSAFHNSSLDFGFAELGADFIGTRTITVKNDGDKAVTLSASQAAGPGSRTSSMTFSPASVTVAAGGEATLDVTLNVPAASVGGSGAFRQVSGAVQLSGDGVSLRVPYLLVPRALSNVSASLSGNLSPNGKPVTLSAANPSGVTTGTVDLYQWGLEDGDDVNEAIFGGSGYDMRAVGVQAFEWDEDNQLIVFAISTHDRWSTAAVNEFDININVDDDPDPEYAVVGVDIGAVLTGSFNGQMGAFVFDLINGGATIEFPATAPTDSSTLLLPVLSSQLGLTAEDGNFEYTAVSFSLEGAGVDPMKGKAGFNPWTPALTNFAFLVVPRNGTASDQIAIDPVAFQTQKMLGVMGVIPDNASGAAEAQLIKAPGNPRR